jgi:hypothetical protein
VNIQGETAEFFPGSRSTPALSVIRSRRAPLDIEIEAWPASPTGARKWAESCSARGVTARHVVSDLQPQAVYDLRGDGQKLGSYKADAAGRIEFKRALGSAAPTHFELGVQ